MAGKNEDAYIDVNDVQVSPRGRKPVLNPDLVAYLAGLPAGKAAVLSGFFGNVDSKARPAVSATIRKHWRAAHGEDSKPRIDYTLDGVAQVRYRDSK